MSHTGNGILIGTTTENRQAVGKLKLQLELQLAIMGQMMVGTSCGPAVWTTPSNRDIGAAFKPPVKGVVQRCSASSEKLPGAAVPTGHHFLRSAVQYCLLKSAHAFSSPAYPHC